MSSRLLLASVLDNGDAGVIAAGTPGAVDAGTIADVLAELDRTGAELGSALLRLVATPDAVALEAAHLWVAACSAAGHPVDAVIVTRVPRKADGFPEPWAAPIRARAAEFAESCAVPVIAMRLRPRARQVGRVVTAEHSRERPPTSAPIPDGDGFSWRIDVDGIARVGEVRAGAQGDRLVIELDGTQVRRRLPAVLARCRATGASVDASGMTVAFEPDPAQWPQGSRP